MKSATHGKIFSLQPAGYPRDPGLSYLQKAETNEQAININLLCNLYCYKKAKVLFTRVFSTAVLITIYKRIQATLLKSQKKDAHCTMHAPVISFWCYSRQMKINKSRPGSTLSFPNRHITLWLCTALQLCTPESNRYLKHLTKIQDFLINNFGNISYKCSRNKQVF